MTSTYDTKKWVETLRSLGFETFMFKDLKKHNLDNKAFLMTASRHNMIKKEKHHTERIKWKII